MSWTSAALHAGPDPAVHPGPPGTYPRCGGHAWRLNSTYSCILEGLTGTRVRHWSCKACRCVSRPPSDVTIRQRTHALQTPVAQLYAWASATEARRRHLEPWQWRSSRHPGVGRATDRCLVGPQATDLVPARCPGRRDPVPDWGCAATGEGGHGPHGPPAGDARGGIFDRAA